VSIRTILVSQPKPEGKSPYTSLADKYDLKVDFRRFIQVEGIEAQEFRQQRVDFESTTAVILTSRTAVDHFFRMAKEIRFTVPDDMKYFCISESTALYLQNYVTYRKRKIFFGKQAFRDLLDIIKKHKSEKFLFPCSDIHKQSIPNSLTEAGVNFDKAVLYRTVASDLSDLADVNYDLLVFFSPSGIESLFKNFPEFKQKGTKIAAFGPSTANAVKKHNLNLDVHAPMPNAPSMTMAIEQYILNFKKKKK
jgi:uroporphyrinogen-III synthase